jgi:hypothetical protein
VLKERPSWNVSVTHPPAQFPPTPPGCRRRGRRLFIVPIDLGDVLIVGFRQEHRVHLDEGTDGAEQRRRNALTT